MDVVLPKWGVTMQEGTLAQWNVAEGAPVTEGDAIAEIVTDKVLSLLRPLTKGKLIAVFGSAGERDRAKRPRLAEVASRYTDLFVITQEDPRLEDPAQILNEIEAGAIGAGRREGEHYLVIADRTRAISEAIHRARAGDTVLLAGKGHEGSIIVGEEKVPWDEAAAARGALGEVGFAA